MEQAYLFILLCLVFSYEVDIAVEVSFAQRAHRQVFVVIECFHFSDQLLGLLASTLR